MPEYLCLKKINAEKKIFVQMAKVTGNMSRNFSLFRSSVSLFPNVTILKINLNTVFEGNLGRILVKSFL